MPKKAIALIIILLMLACQALAQESRGLSGPKSPETGTGLTFDIEENYLENFIKSPLVWILAIGTIFWARQFKKAKRNTDFQMLGMVLGIGYLIAFSALVPIQEANVFSGDSDWLVNYRANLPDEYSGYTAATSYYDLNHPTIQGIANDILVTAESEKEAIQLALDYIFTHVTYNYFEDNNACFDGIASDIIESGTGQCDTQGIALIAVLRAMGIAARPVGGCLSLDSGCELRQSLFSISTVNRPKWVEIEEEFDPTAEYFSRGDRLQISRGIVIPRKGGLHLWTEAWSVEENEWLTLEETSGEIMDLDTSCYNYDLELRPDDNDKFHLCVSDNLDFVLWCIQQ